MITVIPIVIWAVPGNTPQPVYQRSFEGNLLTYQRYFEIHLADLDWHGLDPLLYVLAPYLQGVTAADLPTLGVQLYQTAPVEHRAALLGAFFALGRQKFERFGEIEAEILRQVRETMNEILEAIVMEFGGEIRARAMAAGKAEGIAEGKAEGIAEGKAEGKAEGMHAAIRLLWQQRFGAIPPEIDVLVDRLSLERARVVVTIFAAGLPEAEVRAAITQ